MKHVRPYPAPTSPWLMRQTWSELLFAHWPLPPAALRPLLPPGLPLDTYDGQAWLSIVPFRMSDVAPRGVPAVPWLSAFPELNVRTYVARDGRPGVWFFSLEAANPVAVQIARTVFRLPYFNAAMHVRSNGQRATSNEQAASIFKMAQRPRATSTRSGQSARHSRPAAGQPRLPEQPTKPFLAYRSSFIAYRSVRSHRGAPPAAFQASYAPTGPVEYAEPGTLADWLTARYCLYTTDRRGRALRAEIDHAPWPLQPARATIRTNSLAAAAGLALPDLPPLLQYVDSLNVHVWPVRRVRPGG